MHVLRRSLKSWNWSFELGPGMLLISTLLSLALSTILMVRSGRKIIEKLKSE
ncbi:MAG: hypothetical protein ACUVQ0_07065 [Thermoproteota archaeon]